jgi:tetratricopeptide (TPR) repeat protein
MPMESSATPRDPRARECYRRGLELARADRSAEALEEFRNALQVEPGWSEVRGELAWALYRLKDSRGALAELDRAVREEPRDPWILRTRALVREDLDDVPGALEDLALALQIRPDRSEIYVTRGWIRMRSGDLDAALLDCEAALRLAPGSPQAHCCRGAIRIEREDWAAAEADLRKALELDPAYDAPPRFLETLARRRAVSPPRGLGTAAGVVNGIALAALAAALLFLRLPEIRPPSPAEGARRLADCANVRSQSDLLFAIDHGVRVAIPLTPDAVRELQKRRVHVEPLPDHPGGSPLILLFAAPVALGIWLFLRRRPPALPDRRAAVCALAALSTLVTIHGVNWQQGAMIDASPEGILGRAIEKTPPSLRAAGRWAWAGSPESRLVLDRLEENRVLVEQLRTEQDVIAWAVGDVPGRWILGLAFLALCLGALARAFDRDGDAARFHVGALFAVLMGAAALCLLDRGREEPAFAYWLGYLLALAVVWRCCHWACPKAGEATP